jgi:hypothetical protein
MILQCRFHPQAWINGYAVDVDAEGECEFAAAWPDDKPVPKDDSYDSDDLRQEGAQWVRDWRGPFYVEIVDNLVGRRYLDALCDHTEALIHCIRILKNRSGDAASIEIAETAADAAEDYIVNHVGEAPEIPNRPTLATVEVS